MAAWVASHSDSLVGFGALATVAAAVVAILALVRAMLDSTSRTRPNVVVEYELPEHSFSRMDLVVRNAGPTSARALDVQFSPPFDPDDEQHFGAFVARRYAERISALGPGQRLVSLLHVSVDNEQANDVPALLKVKVSYQGPWWRRRYVDTFTLQRVIYEQHIYSESSDSPSGYLKKIANATHDMAASQKTNLKYLASLIEAVGQQAQLLSSPKPGVSWHLRDVDPDSLALENVGSEVAFDVRTEKGPGVRALSVRGNSTKVAPGERLKLHALISSSEEATLRVTWAHSPDAPARHEWETTIAP